MNYAKRKKNLRFYCLLYANSKEKNYLGGNELVNNNKTSKFLQIYFSSL